MGKSMNPDPFADAQADLHDISHGNFGSLGGTPNAPRPEVIHIMGPPAKGASRSNIGKRAAKTNPKVKTPLKNPERIGTGGKGIPQSKPPMGKSQKASKAQAPPAKSAKRIPMATKAQAKTVKPMQVKPKGKSVDKVKER